MSTTIKQKDLDELMLFGLVPEGTKKKFYHNTDKRGSCYSTTKIDDQHQLVNPYSSDAIGTTSKVIIDNPRCHMPSSIYTPGAGDYDVLIVHPEILHLLD